MGPCQFEGRAPEVAKVILCLGLVSLAREGFLSPAWVLRGSVVRASGQLPGRGCVMWRAEEVWALLLLQAGVVRAFCPLLFRPQRARLPLSSDMGPASHAASSQCLAVPRSAQN